jgi:hypothetical protein
MTVLTAAEMVAWRGATAMALPGEVRGRRDGGEQVGRQVGRPG